MKSFAWGPTQNLSALSCVLGKVFRMRLPPPVLTVMSRVNA